MWSVSNSPRLVHGTPGAQERGPTQRFPGLPGRATRLRIAWLTNGVAVVVPHWLSHAWFRGKITGNPDPKHVSTSYAERANLTIRTAMGRFTPLTNAFSKKLENHAHMVALYALWYNFVRIHKTLRTSPAMAAGIETRLWSMEDVARLIEAREDLRSGALMVG
jgi:IS1 family transposase